MPRLAALCLLAACASARPPAYSERCDDAARPCTFSYDFEPSGAAPDVFGRPGSFLVLNEDGAMFRWNLASDAPWDHDHVALVGSVAPALNKVESATSAVCDGRPVLVAAANFMPGRQGRSPARESIAAVVGALDAKPWVLEKTGAAVARLRGRYASGKTRTSPDVGSIASQTPVTSVDVKVEGLALSSDCRTLYVGVRSYQDPDRGEVFVRDVAAFALDVDWSGTREDATEAAGGFFALTGPTCSGHDEGISDLVALPDGGLLALTSYERELTPRRTPRDVPQGELAGTLWKRGADGRVVRVACFPGHKPEALALMPDAKSVRVVFEDDDYGGRPIPAFAVRVVLP